MAHLAQMQCSACGAPFEPKPFEIASKCTFCGAVIQKIRPVGTQTQDHAADPEELFKRKLYAACRKVCEEILLFEPGDIRAQLFLGLAELFRTPEDYFSIDRDLYFLLIDKATTPVGPLAIAFGNIRSAIAESQSAQESLLGHIRTYYQTRTIPSNYSSSFGNAVMRTLSL